MAIKMLSIEDLDLADKRVFVRVDINTPVHPETGELIEQARLEEAATTIRDLEGSRVVVASHQGRVGRSDYVSLKMHSQALSRILGKDVKFVEDVFGPEALRSIDALGTGEVLVLDNLRFTAEENQEYRAADAEKTFLVKRLRDHVDACVLDAFSTAHRASPTIVGFAGLVPTCAGVVVAKELRALDKIASVEKGPYVTVLGGAKVNDRMEAIDALVANRRADKVLLCGLVGLIFLKASGRYRSDIGIDNEQKYVVKARQLIDEDPERYEVPIDVAIKVDGARKEVDVTGLPPQTDVLDIGTRTVDRFSRLIKGAGTVFMSGPPGAFEWEAFSKGTESLLEAMGASYGTTIVSGGHLSTALQKYGIERQIDHISTAGGALVQYLAGKRLPLIDSLERAADKWGHRAA
ncbi:MAG TPA: phosphoglycerate kinase [Nitrososphaerales archaeon]|nr:phosphoglycerate kinase [Nitrososphaerales archaeon]